MTEQASAIHKHSFFDSIWARLIAALVALGGVALFVAANPVLFEPEAEMAGAGNSGYQQCLDERIAAVDKLAAEAGFSIKQKELARIRAAETCRNLTAAQ